MYRMQGAMGWEMPSLPGGMLVGSFFDIFVEVDTPSSGPPGGSFPPPGQIADSFFDITYRIGFTDGQNNPIGTLMGDGSVRFLRRNVSDPNHPETLMFDTEMLQLDIRGSSPLGPLMIRESPTLPSRGASRIDDLGGGQYHIDSFFDVFTELSLDGGQSWIPSRGDGPGGSTHFAASPVPEPASVATLGLGVLALLRKRRACR